MKTDKYDKILNIWLCVITAIASLYCLLLILVITSNEANAQSTAGREIANIQSWLNEGSQGFYKPGTGDQWVRNVSANGDRFIKVESTIDYKASNGRNYPVPIEKTGQIDGSKIGKAVVKMAKFLPPLALGFEVYSLICELSNICKKQDADEFEYSDSVVDYDRVKTLAGWERNGEHFSSSLETILESQGCGGFYICDAIVDTYSESQLVVKNDKRLASSGGLIAIEYYNKLPYDSDELQLGSRAPTDEDWINAETQLNDERFDEPLLANGQPVPLVNLPVLGNVQPIIISDTETVNRDSQYNVTGTTRTTTTLEITDSATTERPGSVTGIETTTKTDYDTSGQPTVTQTSTNTPPPPDKPQEPTTISFDDVPDSGLEEEEIDFDLAEGESWGEGVCPADVDLGIYGLTFAMQPACDFATGIRPAIIFMASIVAMFIVSGVRVE